MSEISQGRLGILKTARYGSSSFILVQPSVLVFDSTCNKRARETESERLRYHGKGDWNQAFLGPNPIPTLIKSCTLR